MPSAPHPLPRQGQVLRGRAVLCAVRELAVVALLHRAADVAQHVANRRLRDDTKAFTSREVHVAVLVNVSLDVGAKIHRIRAGGEAPVELVRVEYLNS